MCVCVCVCVCVSVCVWECVIKGSSGTVDMSSGEEAIRLQQHKFITDHLFSSKIISIILWGNPCPPLFLPSLALSLFFSLPLFSTDRQIELQSRREGCYPLRPVSLFMNEGG